MAYHRTTVLAWALALAAIVLAAGPAQAQAVGYQGNVSSVNPQAGELVITDALTDRNFELIVTPTTRIVSSFGQPLTLGELKKGDGLGVAAIGAQALSINVNQGVLRGIISALALDDGSITVTENGTDRSVKVPVTSETPIRSGKDQPLGFRTLKSGDGVLVVYNGRGVARIVVKPKPAELTGYIKSVGADMRSLLVTEAGTNADYKVVISPQTEVLSAQGQSLEMKDLHKGDGVGIAHAKGVASKIVIAPAPAR